MKFSRKDFIFATRLDLSYASKPKNLASDACACSQGITVKEKKSKNV
jgi:hypothetical protein